MDWWQFQEVSRLPENWNWTLSVQRELPGKFLVEASYNASVGIHLMSGLLNVNQLDSKYLSDPRVNPLRNVRFDATGSPLQAAGFSKPYPAFPNSLTLERALRPFPQYANINTWSGNGDRSGHSTYHAAIIEVERRVSTGVYLQGSYVFSKLLTNTDLVDSGGRAMDFYNMRLEKSVGAFDLPHNFKFSYILDAPIGKGRKFDLGGVGNAVLGGWRFSAIHVYTSGQPIQLTGGAVSQAGRSAALSDAGRLGCGRSRQSELPGDVRLHQLLRSDLFDRGLLQRQRRRRFADQYLGQRAALQRECAPSVQPAGKRLASEGFNFTERFRLDFRWEVFNVFNRVILGGPDSSITSQSFGRITSAQPPPDAVRVEAVFLKAVVMRNDQWAVAGVERRDCPSAIYFSKTINAGNGSEP